jgi:hypothetical protein
VAARAAGPLGAAEAKFLVQGEEFFDRHGGKAVFLARWLPALRVTGAWLAGASRMPWPRFVLWNMLGGVTWAATVALACTSSERPRQPSSALRAHAACGPRTARPWRAARPKASPVRGKLGLQLMIQLPLSVIGDVVLAHFLSTSLARWS